MRDQNFSHALTKKEFRKTRKIKKVMPEKIHLKFCQTFPSKKLNKTSLKKLNFNEEENFIKKSLKSQPSSFLPLFLPSLLDHL